MFYRSKLLLLGLLFFGSIINAAAQGKKGKVWVTERSSDYDSYGHMPLQGRRVYKVENPLFLDRFSADYPGAKILHQEFVVTYSKRNPNQQLRFFIHTTFQGGEGCCQDTVSDQDQVRSFAQRLGVKLETVEKSVRRDMEIIEPMGALASIAVSCENIIGVRSYK